MLECIEQGPLLFTKHYSIDGELIATLVTLGNRLLEVDISEEYEMLDDYVNR
jgi:hypothetical protein